MKPAALLLLVASIAQPQSPLEYYLSTQATALFKKRAATIASLSTAEQVRERQRYVREKFLAAIGGLPTDKTPLNARITGRLDRTGYTIHNLIFESLPGFYVTANLYVPTTGKAPYPAVLGVAGHSNNGKASATYQSVWISLARRGFIVLAYDPPGQGERSEYFDADTGRSRIGIGTTEHIMAGMQCMLTGHNIARYEIWDGIRALDYLLTRNDVDPTHIAVAGNSGGGTQAAYLAALEPRLHSAVSSCYITSWEQLWTKLNPQDSEQVFAGFVRDGLDLADFPLAFAPKPFLITSAVRDFFPIDGARAAYKESQRTYTLLDASPQVGFFEYDDTHGWSQPRRQAAYRWLSHHMKGTDESGDEAPFDTEPEASLYATITGQLATSAKAFETVQSLNAKYAASLRRRTPTREELAAILGVEQQRPTPRLVQLTPNRQQLETEPGIRVPLQITNPAETSRRPAILIVGSAGTDARDFARAGYLVASIQPRGTSDNDVTRTPAGYSGPYQLSMRAILLGRTIAGMQVTDVLSTFDYLRQRPDVEPTSISILGKGNNGIIATFAAALEPHIARLAAEDSIVSYMDICRATIHENMPMLIVPGILQKFDIPDLAPLILPRPYWIVSPHLPGGGRMEPSRAASQLSPEVRVIERAEAWPATKVYASWTNPTR